MTAETGPDQSSSPTGTFSRRVVLRGCVGLVLGGGMAWGWAAMGRQSARRQAEAVRQLERLGARVYRDYQWRDGQTIPEGQPQQLGWIRRLVGEEMLDRAVAVDLSNVAQPEEALQSLLLLPHLTDLNARDAPLSDQALRIVGRISSLTHADFSGTLITDGGIEQLGNLLLLTSLSLGRTEVSDDCVVVLARLRHLRQLDLSKTRITTAAVVWLSQRLPKCRIQKPTN